MRILFLIVYLCCISTMSAQIEVSLGGYARRNLPENIDSVFKNFEDPRLDDKFYKGDYIDWNDLMYICDIKINTDGTVKSIEIYPLNKGHRLNERDPIWNEGTAAINESSKKWVFKEVIWDIDDFEYKEAKELFTKFNNEKINLPFNGIPDYCLLIRICNMCVGGTNTFISSVEVSMPYYKD